MREKKQDHPAPDLPSLFPNEAEAILEAGPCQAGVETILLAMLV